MSGKKYLLAQMVYFDDKEYHLWLIDHEDESIILPSTLGRLLTHLIESSGKIVEREELLTLIWDKWGLTPSTNALRQTVSQLRQIFRKLGIEEEVIETIPRVGVRIDTSKVQVIDGTPVIENKQNIKKVKNRHRWPSLIVFLIVALLFAVGFFYYKNKGLNDNFDGFTLNYFMKVGNCAIYTLKADINENHLMKSHFDQKNLEKEIPCIKNAIYIVDYDYSYMLKGYGRLFLTRCLNLNDDLNEIGGCETVYEQSFEH